MHNSILPRIGTVALFGPLHLLLIVITGAVATLLSWLCRREKSLARPLRLALGCGLAVNELVWWAFRYSHEGIHASNLPLQLCDATVWSTVLACVTLVPGAVEFSYFAGIAGAGLAILTPDLWSPWPSYPAIYFFLGHGGIVVGAAMLVFGGIAPLRRGAVWRAYGWLLAYTGVMSIFDAISGANYMYLRQKPRTETLLNALGPWPVYILVGMALGLGLFWVMWLPARRGK